MISCFSVKMCFFCLCVGLSFYLEFAIGLSIKPNILLIVVDDLRPVLSACGDTLAVTPNIDQVAKAGVVFQNAYAQQALCAPSRTSFLTSRRPDSLRLYDAHSYWRVHAGNFTSLPQHFKENGYHTVSVGKVFHPGIVSNHSDDYLLSWSEKPYHAPTEKYKFSKVCPSLDNSKKPLAMNLVCPVDLKMQPGGSLPDIQATEYVKTVIQKLRQMKRKPFFIGLGYHKPHIPLKYPKEYRKLYPLQEIKLAQHRHRPKLMPEIAWNPFDDLRLRDDIKALNLSYPFGYVPDHFQKLIKQSYYAATSYVDDLIGQTIQSLQDASLLHDTVIVIVGDHGWSLGEHGEWSKYSNFDVSLKVPLIIATPFTVKSKRLKLNWFRYVSPLRTKVRMSDFAKSTLEDYVELVDLFPTLAQLANIPVPNPCPRKQQPIFCTEGRSLVPMISQRLNVPSTAGKSVIENKFARSLYPRPTIEPGHSSDQPQMDQIRFMGYTMKNATLRFTQWLGYDCIRFHTNWTHVQGQELYLLDADEVHNLAMNPKYVSLVKQLAHELKNEWEMTFR